MLKNLKIGTKLLISFLIMIVLIVAVGLVGILNQTQLAAMNTRMSQDILTGLMRSAVLHTSVIDFQRVLFEHILHTEESQYADFESEVDTDRAKIVGTLDALTKSSFLPEIAQVFEEIQALIPPLFSDTDTVLELSRAGSKVEAAALAANTVDPPFDTIVDNLTQVREFFTAISDSSQKVSNDAAATAELSMLALIVLAVVFALVVAFALQRSIRSSLKISVALAKSISVGDLTTNIPTKALSGGDELGDLVRALKTMRDDLATNLRQIDQSSDNLESVGHELNQSLTHASTSVEAIGATVIEVNERVLNQSASVTETSATIAQIVKSIEGLERDISEQASAVTESSASIEQMLSNIQSVTKTIEAMGDEFVKLTAASDDGKSRLVTVSEKIKSVSAQSERLLEANNVIKEMASQTNLLAMNAAIEAAHAGDAGRGFAVVADEIRKLAEMSSTQSGAISKDISGILKEILLVVEASGSAEAAFGQILDNIDVLNRYEHEVRNGMQEQNQGSRQILDALGQINAITTHVKDSSYEIADGSRNISTEMHNLASVSEQLASSMHRIEAGTAQIQSATDTLESAESRNSAQIAVLAGIVSKFQLDN